MDIDNPQAGTFQLTTPRTGSFEDGSDWCLDNSSTMSIARAIQFSTGCKSCRLDLLHAFTTVAGLSIQTFTRPRHPRFGTTNCIGRRSLFISPLCRSDLAQLQRPDYANSAEEASLEEDLSADIDEALSSSPSTPWYLHVDTPQRVSNPLLDRQRIPELPPDPPPLLKPMLEHISIDLGLDDLTVFDLREIDPPLALGANLLMILGTARSEKHLHVSADRFCRWLKTTYTLKPYADGLLGRGELKLKMRRRARRARLLSNVGSSETSNTDDGIRTGWICVNVGTIDDGRRPVEESFSRQEGYVGFGSEVGGAKVVIQMLTEEKREELDLESLWGKMIKRHGRKEERISRGQEDVLILEEVAQS